MAETGSSSVLARKLAASGADRGKGRSALRALRLALARTAKDLFDLSLAVIGAKQARIEQAAAEGFLSDDRLLVVLDGGQGQAGVVSMDIACVTALTQQQTMGRVTGTMAESRGFTGTDAALAEPLIEMLLSSAAILADSPDDQRCLEGFRFGAMIEDVRSLMLVLDTKRYRVFDLTIDIAEGAMQGAICLILPDLPPEADKNGDVGPPGPRLDQGFGVMRADLTASIGRMRISLAELSAMRPGDVLPLTRERLEQTQLISIDGKPVAAGRLGQINGLRAVRLNETKGLGAGDAMAEQQGFAANVTEASGPGPARLALGTPDLGMMGEGGLPDLPAMDGALSQVLPMGGDLPELPELPEMAGGLPGELPELPGVAAIAAEEAALEDDALARMTPEQAALEITQLAGLDKDEGDG